MGLGGNMSKENRLPNRLGKMAKDENGNLVLINEEDKAFAINSDLSKIWFMLDGEKTISEVVRQLSKDAETSSKEIQRVVEIAIAKLATAKLVTWDSVQRSSSSETSETSI